MKPIYFQDFVRDRGHAARGLDPRLLRPRRLDRPRSPTPATTRSPAWWRRQGQRASSPRTSTTCTRTPASRPTRSSSCTATPATPPAWSAATRHELDELKASFLETGEIPDLPRLRRHREDRDHLLRPAHAARADGARAEAETLACDLFLVLGSSLVVYPAAGFPLMAKRNGARLAIVNREPTDLDAYADLVLHDEIGPVLSEIIA